MSSANNSQNINISGSGDINIGMIKNQPVTEQAISEPATAIAESSRIAELDLLLQATYDSQQLTDSAKKKVAACATFLANLIAADIVTPKVVTAYLFDEMQQHAVNAPVVMTILKIYMDVIARNIQEV